MSYGQSPDLLPLFVFYICSILSVFYVFAIVVYTDCFIEEEKRDITKSYSHVYEIGLGAIWGLGSLLALLHFIFNLFD